MPIYKKGMKRHEYKQKCNPESIPTLYRDPGGTLSCVAKVTQDAKTFRSAVFLNIALWKYAKSWLWLAMSFAVSFAIS